VCDEHLLAALATDLNSSFERLVLAYQRRLYAFVLRLCSRPEDAEEIAQDAFVRAYRALASYPAERVCALALRPWLFRIALNVARNRARVRQPELVPLGDPDGDEAAYPELEDDERAQPASLVERGEQIRALEAHLRALPTRYRAAVVLRHVEGLSYDEAAAALGQPVGTVKANVHRGVRLLRQALASELTEVRCSGG
jgi:RNA polymerase sigma-70 factor (ECF subfamily)